MAYLGRLSTDAYGFTAQEVKIAAIDYNAVEAAAAGPVHAAITALTTKDVVTETEITNPPCARCLVVDTGRNDRQRGGRGISRCGAPTSTTNPSRKPSPSWQRQARQKQG